MISRRSLLIGFTSILVTAPAIVRAGSLMPVRTPITRRSFGIHPRGLVWNYEYDLVVWDDNLNPLSRQPLGPDWINQLKNASGTCTISRRLE